MGADVFDLIIIVTLVFFTLRGLSNGFIGEVAGILSLLVGFWAARTFNMQLTPHLTFIADPNWRNLASCVILFVGAMVVVGLLARLLKKIIALSFAAWADRLAGAFLGLAKGIIVWLLIIIVLEKFFRNAPFMQQSRALAYFSSLLDFIRPWLPPALADHITLGS